MTSERDLTRDVSATSYCICLCRCLGHLPVQRIDQRITPQGRLGLDVELGQFDPKAFDQLFLSLMIKHHQGAVTMSGTVIDKGTDPQIGELAQEVGVTQTKEIATMRQLQKGL